MTHLLDIFQVYLDHNPNIGVCWQLVEKTQIVVFESKCMNYIQIFLSPSEAGMFFNI